jgi:nucleotide-binding universal stress UspA family protein
MMYRTILVPLDGSPRAERILPHVEGLALANKSKVILLQVVNPGAAELMQPMAPMGAPVDIELYLGTVEEAEEKAHQYLLEKASVLEAKNIKAQGMVRRGEIVRTVIQVAAEQNVDLVAMASHGRTGLSRVFYGSVANGVLHQIDRPLLLIRAED